MGESADVFQYFLGALPHFLGYFCFAVFLFGLFLLIYLWVTPYAEIELIRGGNLAAALNLGGALLGFSLPLASTIAHSVSILDVGLWALVALVLQIGVHFLSRVLIKDMVRLIESGMVSVGAMACCLSLGFGVLNAACLTY
jgi:putative membrane protein